MIVGIQEFDCCEQHRPFVVAFILDVCFTSTELLKIVYTNPHKKWNDLFLRKIEFRCGLLLLHLTFLSYTNLVFKIVYSTTTFSENFIMSATDNIAVNKLPVYSVNENLVFMLRTEQLLGNFYRGVF
jgi:hypothetical protein